MPAKKLREFLDGHDTRYVTISHSRAYTAQEIAESAHIRGKELAKTVMVKIDGKMAMAVVPASERVDLQLLKQGTGDHEVDLATEQEFEADFPDCEPGAMPPFGNLYAMEVFVSPRLSVDEEIAFSAGTHTELVRLTYQDYADLVSPIVIRLSSKD